MVILVTEAHINTVDGSFEDLTGKYFLTLKYTHPLINNPCDIHLEMIKEAGVVEFLKSSIVTLSLHLNLP